MLRPSLAHTGHISKLGLNVSCVRREPSVLTTKMSVLTTLLMAEVEMETFIAVDAVDYILLQEYIATWCHNHDIWCGPARGSAASSLALYILHVTEVNPMKHNFAFWRFMNKDKYSLAD